MTNTVACVDETIVSGTSNFDDSYQDKVIVYGKGEMIYVRDCILSTTGQVYKFSGIDLYGRHKVIDIYKGDFQVFKMTLDEFKYLIRDEYVR